MVVGAMCKVAKVYRGKGTAEGAERFQLFVECTEVEDLQAIFGHEELKEAFGTTLLGYKEKMSEAYQDRERKVEEELADLKR